MRRLIPTFLFLTAVLPPQTAADLFSAARRGISELPAELAPRELLQIGLLEAKTQPAQAVADFERAFDLAQAIAVPPAGDAAAPFREREKEAAEAAAVAQLLASHQEEIALTLTRRADGPREPLYSELLMHSAAKPDFAPDGALALAAECESASGVYPFLGMTMVLKQAHLDAISAVALARAGYQAADNTTDSGAIGDAARFFLPAAHRLAPQLDNQLEAAIETLLARAANSGYPADPSNGQVLLGLLRQFDPARASELDALYPGYAGAGPVLFELLPLDPDAAAAAGLGLPGVNDPRAAMIEPGQVSPRAIDGANLERAYAQLTPESIAADPAAAILLAGPLRAAGRTVEMQRLLTACLDAAADDVVQFDHDYANADPPGQERLFANRATQIASVYQRVGAIDFGEAVRRAQALPTALLRPMVLARLAAMAGEPAAAPGHPPPSP